MVGSVKWWQTATGAQILQENGMEAPTTSPQPGASFKVGDRVRTVFNEDAGRVGTILFIYSDGAARVMMDQDLFVSHYHLNELRLVEEPKPVKFKNGDRVRPSDRTDVYIVSYVGEDHVFCYPEGGSRSDTYSIWPWNLTLVEESKPTAPERPANKLRDALQDLTQKTEEAGGYEKEFHESDDETRLEPDAVNHPPHYTQGGIECIDAIEAALTPEEFRGYCKGNALKYIWRERHKGGDESMAKAQWYLKRAT